MTAFATIDDITRLWRPLTHEEQAKADALLKVVSASLRTEANKVGKDLES